YDDRALTILNGGLAAGGAQLNALRVHREVAQVNFLVVGMHGYGARSRERSLRLSGIRVELDLLPVGRGREIELVDVLPAQRRERRMRFGGTGRVGGAQLRHAGGEIARDRDRTVVAVIEIVAGEGPVD